MLLRQPKSNPPPTLSSVFGQRGLSYRQRTMRSRLTRRQVTASLALSGLWAVVRGTGVSAQERAVSTVDDRIKRLEQQLEELRQTLKIPGVSAAVVKDQKLLWAKGIGFADVEHKIPAAPET